jgi:hypothetical protein
MRRVITLLCLMLGIGCKMLAMNGTGTAEDPYQISTADELYEFASIVNGSHASIEANVAACAVIMNDIVINENVLDSVGNLRSDGSFRSWTIIDRFEGVLDGKNHVIRGLYVSGADKAGFIMHMVGAEVRNLGFEDSYLTSESGRCGGICGHSRASSTIRNCYYIGSLNCGGREVGGICSLCNASSVINCFSIYKISSAGKIDGICSVREDAEIDNCYSMPFTEAVGSKKRVSFENGEVAYKLQDGQTEHVWGQKIGVDKHPVFGGDTVYASFPCSKYFANDLISDTLQHVFDHCVCKECGFIDTTCFINDWFEIYTVDDLYEFARIVNDGHPMLNARLMNDIVLNEGHQFTVTWYEVRDRRYQDCTVPWPGGDSLTWIVNGFIDSYSGIFDGQNHVIRGLCGALEGGGFIEYMVGGELRNVGIEDIFLYSCISAAFVRSATNTKFSNCYVSGNVLSSQDAASLASYSHSCSFEGCYNMAKIVGYDWGSGITCAQDDNVSVNRCWNAGDVIALNVASGLVTFYSSTWEQDTCFISNSYNLGEIEGTGKGGGVGIATYLSNNGVMSDVIYVDNCYNVGVLAGMGVDPIAYDCNDGRFIYLSNCYYLDSCVAKGRFFEPYPGSVDVHAMSAEQFANGEVCYRLNKGVTDGTQPFYQNLNEVRVRPVPMRPAPVTVDPYPVLDNTHLTVYTDGDTYFNYKTNVGIEQTSDDLSNPLVYVVDRTIYVCNVEGRVLLSDMNGRILFSQKVQKEGTSSCAEIPVRDAGAYLLVVNGAPCKVVAR